MKQRHDWRLVPLAAAAWAGGFLGTSGPPVAMAGLVTVVGSPLLWLLHRRGRTVATLTLLTALLIAGLAILRVGAIHDSQAAHWAADHERLEVVVRIGTETRLAQSQPGRPPLAIAAGTMREADSRHGRLRLRHDVVIFGSAERSDDLLALVPGATYRLTGTASPTSRDTPEPLTLSLRRPPELLAGPGALDRLINQLRMGLRRAASHSPPEQAALVPSLVVGDTHGVSPELSADFRVTALSHLLAVSGANLTLMLSVLLIVVRAVGIRGWGVRVAALLGVGWFVVLCRFEASVIRAAVMGLVTLLAMGMSSGRRTLRGIAVTVLVLMFLDPWLSRSYAFALSVAACLGICLWAQPWVERMVTWAPRWVAEAFCVPLAAQLATQPIITSLSGQISVVGVFANVAAAPFVGPATVLGLLAACVSFLPPVAAVLAWAAGWCVQPIIWVAHLGAALPTAAIGWNSDAWGVAGSLLLSVGLVLVAGFALRRRWASLALVAVLLLVTVLRPSPLGWPGQWAVVFCDVGQGDATVLRAQDGVAVLVDTGPDPQHTLRCLQQLGIREIPVLVLTHYHADHIGGTAEILRRFQPELVVVSPLASPAHAAHAVQEAVLEHGGRTMVAVPGEEFQVGEVNWVTVGAWQPTRATSAVTDGESSAENDASIVAVATVGKLTVMLPGDVEPAGQRRALASARELGQDLRVHVLKLPHHGSSAQEPALFDATGAALAVASAGQNNSYGHPSATALDLARARGMSVARTDEHGHIAVALTGDQLTVRTLAPRR